MAAFPPLEEQSSFDFAGLGDLLLFAVGLRNGVDTDDDGISLLDEDVRESTKANHWKYCVLALESDSKSKLYNQYFTIKTSHVIRPSTPRFVLFGAHQHGTMT